MVSFHGIKVDDVGFDRSIKEGEKESPTLLIMMDGRTRNSSSSPSEPIGLRVIMNITIKLITKSCIFDLMSQTRGFARLFVTRTAI